MSETVKDKKTAFLMAVFFSTLLIAGHSSRAQSLAELDHEISRIVDRISGAVVTVEARPQTSRAPIFPGQNQVGAQTVNAVVGSGLVIDSAGHILTSLRLVEDYDGFRVEINGRTFNAALVGVDHRNNLAVLKVDTVVQSYIEISPFPPTAGRLALAYGHSIDHTGYPALGIIAGRQTDGSYLVSGTILPGLLGGGIFDLSGQLIGVISSGSVSVNDYRGTWGGIIMLPAAVAYAAANRIICCGNRDAGYLGIRTVAIELVSPNQKILGEAVAVSEVEPGSPAALAGLREGDIITRIWSRTITNDRELQQMVNSAGADSTIMIELLRGQRRVQVRVPLASLSPGQGNFSNYRNSNLPERQSQIAVELQKRIDSMWTEMERMQEQLRRLLGTAGNAR